MRYLKKFNNKIERDTAITNRELSSTSVTIFNDKIEYGVGNGEHTVSLGFIDEEDTNSDSSSNE